MYKSVEFVGCVPVQADPGVPPDQADCEDAIAFIRKRWRKTAKYRFGVPKEAQFRIQEKQREVRILARTFAPNPIKKYELYHSLAEIYGSVAMGLDVSYIAKYNPEDCIATFKKCTHVCYIFQMKDEEQATEAAVAIQRHVTQRALERAMLTVEEAKAEALIGEVSEEDEASATPAPASPPKPHVFQEPDPSAQSWYKGPITRQESKELLQCPETHSGDFFVRKSRSQDDAYTLAVKSNARVEHYRIAVKDGFCTLDGQPHLPFPSLEDLVFYYFSVGLGTDVKLANAAQGGEDGGDLMDLYKENVHQPYNQYLSELRQHGRRESATQIERNLFKIFNAHDKAKLRAKAMVGANVAPQRQKRASFSAWETKQDATEGRVLNLQANTGEGCEDEAQLVDLLEEMDT